MMTSIRAMEPDDVPAVATMERRFFPTPYSVRLLHSELAASDRHYLVATDEGAIVGYGGIQAMEKVGHVLTIAVEPARRRMGLGSALLARLLKWAIATGAEAATLEVRPGNQRARRLYRRFGFAPVGIRPGYYGDEDAVVMWCPDLTAPEYLARIDTMGTAAATEASST